MSALRITSIEEIDRDAGEGLPAIVPAHGLTLYETACRALAEARRVDEAKGIRDQAEALRAYARQAKNRVLEVDAAEVRIRAERRVGELIAAQKATVGLNRGAKGSRVSGSEREPVKDDRPTLAEAGIDKKLSSVAQRLAAMPQERFDATLKDWRGRAERDAGRVSVQLVHDTDKKVRRAVREEVLGRQQRALPDRRYGVILADSEWRFEPYSRETGMDRAPENHYPTSPLATLQQRRVADIAASDCVLLLWATVPMLAEAFCVLDAWGFSKFVRDPVNGLLGLDKRAGRYVSSAAWVKYRPGAGIGLGYWFRVDHEILIVATRGDPPAPALGDQLRSVFDLPASRVHSEKPELVLEMAEAFWPTLPKIELNRRGLPRPGWDAWGNEVEVSHG